MTKAPTTTPAKPQLDPHTARTLHELRDVIRAIEAGEVALRRFVDSLAEEQDGMHRELMVRVTLIPVRK